MDTILKATPEAAVPRHRGRPKLISDDAQRSLIADVARQLFVEKGYGRTTTDDVAARCRISKQTLYRLFSGKPALFAAVVAMHRYRMLVISSDYDELPLDEALHRIFRIDIDPQVERDNLALLRMVTLESQEHPELGELLISIGADRARGDLSRWLKMQHKKGLIEIDDPESVAHILLDMIFGPMILTLDLAATRQKKYRRKDHIRRCISIFLNGVSRK